MSYGAYSMKNAFCIQNLSYLIAYSQVQVAKPSFLYVQLYDPRFSELGRWGLGTRHHAQITTHFFKLTQTFQLEHNPVACNKKSHSEYPQTLACVGGSGHKTNLYTTHQFDEYLELTTSLKLRLLQHEQRDGYIHVQVSTFTS